MIQYYILFAVLLIHDFKPENVIILASSWRLSLAKWRGLCQVCVRFVEWHSNISSPVARIDGDSVCNRFAAAAGVSFLGKEESKCESKCWTCWLRLPISRNLTITHSLNSNANLVRNGKRGRKQCNFMKFYASIQLGLKQKMTKKRTKPSA